MKLIPQSLTRSLATQALQAKKASPHLFFAAGLAAVVGGAVLACRATLKLGDKIDDAKNDIDSTRFIQEKSEVEVLRNPKALEQLGGAYARSAYSIVKLYAPAVAVGGIGVALLTGSHVQLTRRNTALTMALSTLSQAMYDYRARVRKELGVDREEELYQGMEETSIIDDKGLVHIVKYVDPNKMSPYAKFFDEFNPNWKRDAEYNRIFIEVQQNWLNQTLIARGHVFLNEAYDRLGIPHTKAGQVVGWVMHGEGDNYIDFGLYSHHNRQFVNGLEQSILLDFNVDGPVLDKI